MMLTALRSRSARLGRQIAARAFATARSNTLTMVAVNDVYDLEHLPKLRTLVDAVKAEHDGVAELLRGGAAVNRANNDGETPVFVATMFGHEQSVALLLRAG